MSRKQVGRNAGISGRTTLSGSEPDALDPDIGATVDIEAADATAFANALIDSTDSEEPLVVTPA